ncbi:MAG: ABC transporter substrate-binding protein, partial [Pseudomonadota bacterium]
MGASRQSSVDGSHRAVTRVAGLMHAARVWIVFAAAALLIGSTGLRANDASPGDPVTIAVMYSSDRNRCFTPGVVTAIRHYTALRAREINANGGIAGRPVRLKYFDDFENADRARANAEAAAKMPLLVGIVGMSSSTRGKGMVDVIGSAGIPWISGMSRSDIFARHRSIYSMEPAVTDEIVAVSRFVRERKVRRPVFLGTKGDLYAASIAEALARAASTKDPSSTREPVSSDPPSADNTDAPPPMAFEAVWLERRPDFRLGEAALTEAVAAIRKADADMIFLALHSGPGAQLLRRLRREGLTPPAFVVLGRIGRIRGLTQPDGYDADMFELGREGVPDVLNERLQQRIWRNPDARWIFSDTRAASSPPGCEKFVAPTPITDVRGRTNRRAIARGLQHGDALMLLAEAAGSATTGDARQRATGEAKTIPAADIRTRIIAGLSAHRRGARIYRGWWQDWSFTPARAVAEQTLLVRQRADESDIALAPTQFVIRDAGARAVPVVYVNVDMVRIFRVDDNEKTFQAEFYLSARSGTAITLGDIEFTNAFRSQLSNAPVISARRIDGGDNDAFRLWRVTGKFTFDPDLGDYPFDRQRFSISFQPSKTTEPFFVQPPPARLRKAEFSSDGWKQLSAFACAGADDGNDVVVRADVCTQ